MTSGSGGDVRLRGVGWILSLIFGGGEGKEGEGEEGRQAAESE